MTGGRLATQPHGNGQDRRAWRSTAPNYDDYGYRPDEPVASLTVRIYNYSISLYDEWHAQAWAVTLAPVAPVAPVLAVNVAVRFVTREKF